MKKNILILATSGLLLMLTLSCGKETKKKAPQSTTSDAYTNEDQWSSDLAKLFKAATSDDIQTFRQIYFKNPLIDLNALVGAQTDTVLITVLKNRSRKIFDFIMARGSEKGVEKSIDLELMSQDSSTFGMSPLSIATINGRYQMTKILLQKGVSINSVDRNGYTALHYALLNKKDDMAILLLQNRADINMTDPSGRNAYRMALELDCVGTIDYIHGLAQISQGTIPESLTLKKLIEVGDVAMVYRVLARHPDLIKKYEVINPLALALGLVDDNRSFQMVNVLLSAGFGPNGLKVDFESPLIKAVKKNRLLVAELLLQKGADIDLLDGDGYSALYHAINENHAELVDFLVSREAKRFYKHRSAEGKFYFWVCNEARRVKKTLENPQEIQNNLAILRRLNCI